MTELTRITTYVDEKTKKRWVTHIKENNPAYQSLSHLIEDSVEYKIKADNYLPNKVFGFTGPQK